MHHAEGGDQHLLGVHVPIAVHAGFHADVGAVHRAVKGRGKALLVVFQLDHRALAVGDNHIALVLAQVAVPHEGIDVEAGDGVGVGVFLHDLVVGDGHAEPQLVHFQRHFIADGQVGIGDPGHVAVPGQGTVDLVGGVDEVRLQGEVLDPLQVFHHDAALVEPLPGGVVLHVLGILHGGIHHLARGLAFHDQRQGVPPQVEIEPAVLGDLLVGFRKGGALRFLRPAGQKGDGQQAYCQEKSQDVTSSEQSDTPPLRKCPK